MQYFVTLETVMKCFLQMTVTLGLLVYSSLAAIELLGGSPLSTDKPPYEARNHPKPPNDALFGGSAGLPYETNSWWQNFVLDNGDQPVIVLPYSVKAADDGLIACLSNKVSLF